MKNEDKLKIKRFRAVSKYKNHKMYLNKLKTGTLIALCSIYFTKNRHGQLGNLGQPPGSLQLLETSWYQSVIASTCGAPPIDRHIRDLFIRELYKIFKMSNSPSIKDYKDRLRLLEKHIGSLRRQNADLVNENESLKEEAEKNAKLFSTATEKLNKMDQLLTQKNDEIANLRRKLEASSEAKPSSVKKAKVEDFEMNIGPEPDFVTMEPDLDPNEFIKELETIKYDFEKTGKNKYKCPADENCRYEAEKSTMIEHTRKHTGERPFECTICNVRLVTRSTARRHIRAHHMKNLMSNKAKKAPNSETGSVIDDGGCLVPVRTIVDPPVADEPPKTRKSLRRSCTKRKHDTENDNGLYSEKRRKNDV